jgi:hypothetical protein
MARIQSETLKKLVRRAMTTRADEIGCETCFEQMDQFVDIQLAGKDASQAMPLVQRHLDLCQGCCDEYEALLIALKDVQDSPPKTND